MKIKISSAKLHEADKIYSALLKGEERDAYTPGIVRDVIENRRSICMVAKAGDKIIGSIGARAEGQNGYWIYFIAVKKEHRNKGVARMLFEKFTEAAKKKGAAKLAADTPECELLKKFGFREVGRIPKWYKDRDQTIMFRKI